MNCMQEMRSSAGIWTERARLRGNPRVVARSVCHPTNELYAGNEKQHWYLDREGSNKRQPPRCNARRYCSEPKVPDICLQRDLEYSAEGARGLVSVVKEIDIFD